MDRTQGEETSQGCEYWRHSSECGGQKCLVNGWLFFNCLASPCLTRVFSSVKWDNCSYPTEFLQGANELTYGKNSGLHCAGIATY